MCYKDNQITYPCSIQIQAHYVDYPKSLQPQDDYSNFGQNVNLGKGKSNSLTIRTFFFMLCFLQHRSPIWFHWIINCVPTSYNYPNKPQSKFTPVLLLESTKRLALIPKMGHRRSTYYTFYITTPIHSSSKHLRNFIQNILETYIMRKSFHCNLSIQL